MCLARLLIEQTDAHIIIAGRNIQKAERAVADLGQASAAGRVAAAVVDAEDLRSLRAAFRGIDMVLLATSLARHAEPVAQAAVEGNLDYLDILYGPAKLDALEAMAREVQRRGLCFITEAGFHPGLPLAVVRYLASFFDRLEKGIVSSVVRFNFKPEMTTPESIYDVVTAFKEKPLVFRGGRWSVPPLYWLWPYRRFRFPAPFGGRNCFPMFLPELRHIPREFSSITETGFYIAGFNWIVDWVLSPLILVSVLLAPEAAVRPMSKLLFWGVKHFTRPPYGTQLMIDATGWKNDQRQTRKLILAHEDGYMFTAIPVVAFLKQYLDGSARKPGLWMMGQLVNPELLIQDMQKMGVVSRTETWAVNSRT